MPREVGGAQVGVHVGQVINPLPNDPEVPRNLLCDGIEILEQSGLGELQGPFGRSPIVDADVIRKPKT
jgi:hypothetical protein